MGFSLSLRNVSFSYSPSPLLQQVSLVLSPGEVVVVEGKTGCGKSTLLKICAGLLEPLKGEVQIDGTSVWHLSTMRQNNLRCQMGFFFQEAALIANMPIFQNLALPLRYRNVPESQISKEIDHWLKSMELFSYRDLLPAALSMGLKRQVGYIRMMMVDARLLFWDEPAVGMSPEFVSTLIAVIEERKRRGVASVISTQDHRLFREVVDRLVRLVDGRLE